MKLYTRRPGGNWWFQFNDSEGQRYRQTCHTTDKKLAAQYAVKFQSDTYRTVSLGETGLAPFSVAVDRFIEEKKYKGVVKEYARQLRWWSEQFEQILGHEPQLHEVNKAIILQVSAFKRAEATAATCNRYRAALRACLRLAQKKYDLITTVPAFFMDEEPKGRTRWLTPDEVQRLWSALPVHVQPPMMLALTTGLRRSIVDQLTWNQLDLDAGTLTVDAANMKGGEHLVLPLSPLALKIVKAQIGKHPTRVWTRNGEPFNRCSNLTWEKAKAAAGIKDLRWHDLRHTWATYLARKGVPDAVLMTLGSWKSVSMVRRYAHHNVESVRASAELIDDAFRSISLDFD